MRINPWRFNELRLCRILLVPGALDSAPLISFSGIGCLILIKASNTLISCGMSHDFEVAIEEGATIVRVGTAIFGERQNPARAATART